MKTNIWIIPGLIVTLTIASCSSRHAVTKEHKQNSFLDDKVTSDRVTSALQSNSGYQFPDVHVASTNGVVLLTGTVQSPQEKARAEQLARQVHRVQDVHNEITVGH